jgi:hypothetical protein
MLHTLTDWKPPQAQADKQGERSSNYPSVKIVGQSSLKVHLDRSSTLIEFTPAHLKTTG